uniref:ACC1 n=1 Tax=Arundo donax TaxID=35708 RepID=A0A0A9E272_ARUDO
MVHRRRHEHRQQPRNEEVCRVSQLTTLMDHGHSVTSISFHQ